MVKCYYSHSSHLCALFVLSVQTLEATVELTLTNTTSQGRREIIGPNASACNTTHVPNSILKPSIVTKTTEEVLKQDPLRAFSCIHVTFM